MAEIQLNGNPEEILDGITVTALLESRNVNPMRVVVELNRRILPREQFESTGLRAGDVVEVVTFVGGG